MPRWLTTVLRLFPIVGGASLVSIVGLIAWRAIGPTDTLHAATNEIGNYLQTVGAVYSVLLAFIVYVVWGQFNEARVYIEREATALVDLYRTATGLPSGARNSIQRSLGEYVDAVIGAEWHAMAKHDEAAIEHVGLKLDEVWVAIHRCQPVGVCQELMYSEALSRFNDVNDLRTNRLTSARFRIPLTLKFLLYNGAVILVGSMFLVHIESLWLHCVVTSSLTGALAHILYLIHDLDDAFTGNLQVGPAPFERARDSFGRVARLLASEQATG